MIYGDECDNLDDLGSFDISGSDAKPINPDNPESVFISKSVDSPFVVIVDSWEQQPFEFQSIIGDHRDSYSPINVRTVRKRCLPTGDYAILGMTGICIERKSKADLFSSMADHGKRENFIERLRKIQETCEFGAVVIECHQSEAISDPPFFTSLNPNSIIQSSISWAQQFPLVHWYWEKDRIEAERKTYDILDKFFEHKTELKYKYHNKPIDSNIDAFKQGQLTRMSMNECEMPYVKGNPLRASWLRGWGFASTRLFGGDMGTLHEKGSSPSTVPREKAKIKVEEKKFQPLPGQTSFLEFNNPNEELSHWIGEQFEQTTRKSKNKKS